MSACAEMSCSRYQDDNLVYSMPMDQLTDDFKTIHASFRPRIHRYLTRLVGPNEAEDLTQEAFLTLPESYRAVVLMGEIEGLTNQEIADVLGLTLETVKIRLHRGRAKLKERLETGCRFDRDEEDILVCDPKADPDRSS